MTSGLTDLIIIIEWGKRSAAREPSCNHFCWVAKDLRGLALLDEV